MANAQGRWSSGQDAMWHDVIQLQSTPVAGRLQLSVVIPVYNELNSILKILLRVQASGLADEIIIVDDFSTDGTRELLRSLLSRQSDGELVADVGGIGRLRLDNIRFLFQPRNQGKGAALRRGFERATKDIVLVQDADLEYDPKDYPTLLQPIIDGLADVVYGSRFLGGPQRVHLFWHYLGNKFLTLLSDVTTNLNRPSPKLYPHESAGS